MQTKCDCREFDEGLSDFETGKIAKSLLNRQELKYLSG